MRLTLSQIRRVCTELLRNRQAEAYYNQQYEEIEDEINENCEWRCPDSNRLLQKVRCRDTDEHYGVLKLSLQRYLRLIELATARQADEDERRQADETERCVMQEWARCWEPISEHILTCDLGSEGTTLVGSFRQDKSWLVLPAGLNELIADWYTQLSEDSRFFLHEISELFSHIDRNFPPHGKVYLIYNWSSCTMSCFMRRLSTGVVIGDVDDRRQATEKILRSVCAAVAHLHSKEQLYGHLSPWHVYLKLEDFPPHTRVTNVWLGGLQESYLDYPDPLKNCAWDVLGLIPISAFTRYEPAEHFLHQQLRLEVFLLGMIVFFGYSYIHGEPDIEFGIHRFDINENEYLVELQDRLRQLVDEHIGEANRNRYLAELIAECFPYEKDYHPTSQLIKIAVNRDLIFTRATTSLETMVRRVRDRGGQFEEGFRIEQMIYPMFAAYVVMADNLIGALPRNIADDLAVFVGSDQLVDVYDRWDWDDLQVFINFVNDQVTPMLPR